GFSATLSSPVEMARYRGLRSGLFSAAGLDGGCAGSGISVFVLPGWILVCAGFGQPLEWAEFPLIVAGFVVLGYVLAIVQFVTPFLKKGVPALYVSAWYIIGGLIFTT